jgi:hypothetical protein
MRASYVWDKSTNSYPERPSEIIKKDKKLDINITKGNSKNPVIETDLRLSVNFENKIDVSTFNQNMNVSKTREKFR